MRRDARIPPPSIWGHLDAWKSWRRAFALIEPRLDCQVFFVVRMSCPLEKIKSLSTLDIFTKDLFHLPLSGIFSKMNSGLRFRIAIEGVFNKRFQQVNKERIVDSLNSNGIRDFQFE